MSARENSLPASPGAAERRRIVAAEIRVLEVPEGEGPRHPLDGVLAGQGGALLEDPLGTTADESGVGGRATDEAGQREALCQEQVGRVHCGTVAASGRGGTSPFRSSAGGNGFAGRGLIGVRSLPQRQTQAAAGSGDINSPLARSVGVATETPPPRRLTA